MEIEFIVSGQILDIFYLRYNTTRQKPLQTYQVTLNFIYWLIIRLIHYYLHQFWNIISLLLPSINAMRIILCVIRFRYRKSVAYRNILQQTLCFNHIYTVILVFSTKLLQVWFRKKIKKEKIQEINIADLLIFSKVVKWTDSLKAKINYNTLSLFVVIVQVVFFSNSQ